MILKGIIVACALIFLAGFMGVTALDYTHEVEAPANVPKGDPDPTLGIVIRPESTGMDVLSDSSQNIRFTVFMNYSETAVSLLSAPSKIDYTPKKITFIDEKHGFSSNEIYEFSMGFNYENHRWKNVRFMPFPSVIEWVTKEKLLAYLTQWAHIFEKAGWKRTSYRKTIDANVIRGFVLPTPEHNRLRYCCSWETDEYKAMIEIALRNRSFYKSYVPKKERKNITVIPDGYIVFINIFKKSQYSSFHSTKKEVKP